MLIVHQSFDSLLSLFGGPKFPAANFNSSKGLLASIRHQVVSLHHSAWLTTWSTFLQELRADVFLW